MESMERNPNDRALTMPRPAHSTDCGRYSRANELFVIPDGDSFLIYAPLKKAVAQINAAGLKALQEWNRTGRANFAQSSFFLKELAAAGVLDSENGEAVRRANPSTVPPNFEDVSPDSISLFLSNRCSMRCVYCYASGGSNARQMDWGIARGAIEWAFRRAAKQKKSRLTLNFHGGGEIATAARVLKQCVSVARDLSQESGIRAHIGAGLNGVLSASMAEWVVKNLNSVTVSLDGLPEIQNSQRPLAGGGASFDAVAKTLHRFDECGFSYGIRMTVTSQGLDRLPDSVRLICETFRAHTIQAEPVYLAGRAANNELTPVDAAAFIGQFRKARAIAESFGRRLKYSGARFGALTDRFCQAAGKSLCVTVDGLVTSCYEVSDPLDSRGELFFYGRFNREKNDFEFDTEKLQRLSSLVVDRKPYCEKCFCKSHCAGDCPAKLALTADPWNPAGNPRCRINRELTLDQLKQYLAREGENAAGIAADFLIAHRSN